MQKLTAVVKAVAKIPGGTKISHFKNTADMQTVKMPPPSKVVIPMQQHIGALCTPVVAKGDTVKLGQLIAESSAPVSAPIHASVSGTVTAISSVRLPSGAVVPAVEIESDGKMEVYEGIKPFPVRNTEDLVAAAKASGLVGLGGAGFPAHIKLSPKAGTKLDTLIINGAECEPYITADYRECIENHDDIMEGVYLVKKLMGFDQVIIGVEDNKPQAIQILHDIAADQRDTNNSVNLLCLKSSYPQGAEKVLIYTSTGRKLPLGKLPADVGCVVMNITSISFLNRFIRTGMPLVTKRLTVDGSAIAKPMNVEVPIGTSIKDVIEFCGGYNCTPEKLILGGPMMGTAVMDDTLPVMKQNNAILAFDQKDALVPDSTACIRCGRCVRGCPMLLRPADVERAMKLGDVSMMSELGVMYCIECGSCTYNCPAKRQLTQSMRVAKAKVRKEGAKK